MLADNRYFDPNLSQKSLAIELYDLVQDAPIISPHDHVAPALFNQSHYLFSNPAALILLSDHYNLRMLYSQNIPFDILLSKNEPCWTWEAFASHFYHFRGTPSGIWITHEMELVFEITEKREAS